MQFREWFVLSESIESNLENWLKTWSAYLEKKDPATLLEVKETIKSILNNFGKQTMLKTALTDTTATGKNHDNQNYLRYLVGYATTKNNFRIEDLKRALDAIDWMLQNGKLTNAQVSTIGWYKVGKNATQYMKEKQEAELEALKPSKTKMDKMKKVGEAFDELTPEVKEGEFTLYLVKGVNPENKEEVSKKHMLLCKYGKDTDWCTADPTGTYHEEYAKNNIFILHKNGKPAYQFAEVNEDVDKSTLQFKNTKDEDVVVVDLTTFNFLLKHRRKEFDYYTLIPTVDGGEATKINQQLKLLIYKHYGKWFDEQFSYDESNWLSEAELARNTIKLITNDINDFEKLYYILVNPDDTEEGTEELLKINPEFMDFFDELDISVD